MENIKYIRHSFIACYLKPSCEPDWKAVTRIYPDGTIIRREFEDNKVVKIGKKQISEAEFGKLVEDIASNPNEVSEYCDAMSAAAIVYKDGKTKHFKASPLSLERFVDSLFCEGQY